MSGPTAVTESELIVRAATGDRAAFRVLYAKAGPRLFAICLRMMRTRDVAEDVFQEAMTRIWERSWQFDPGKGEGLAWLATVTRHCALDRLRRDRTVTVPLDEAATAEIDAKDAVDGLDAASGSDLRRCLEAMREDYRTAVVLSYVNGLTHEELAERLNRPVGTIKSWVRRGLEQLKDCMDQ